MLTKRLIIHSKPTVLSRRTGRSSEGIDLVARAQVLTGAAGGITVPAPFSHGLLHEAQHREHEGDNAHYDQSTARDAASQARGRWRDRGPNPPSRNEPQHRPLATHPRNEQFLQPIVDCSVHATAHPARIGRGPCRCDRARQRPRTGPSANGPKFPVHDRDSKLRRCLRPGGAPAPGARPMSANPGPAHAAAISGRDDQAKGSTRWPRARVLTARGLMNQVFAPFTLNAAH